MTIGNPTDDVTRITVSVDGTTSAHERHGIIDGFVTLIEHSSIHITSATVTQTGIFATIELPANTYFDPTASGYTVNGHRMTSDAQIIGGDPDRTIARTIRIFIPLNSND